MSQSIANVGQHLCVGITGTALTPDTRRLLETVRPGGVVLFSRNIDSPEQLRNFTRQLHDELPVRPLIAIDQENKRVNRLRFVMGELPGIADIKQTGNAHDFGRQIGRALRDYGIDLDFAPVLDLETDADNALRERCWGTTAAEVTRWAGEFIDGLQGENILACAKHFPGLGGAQQDSHELLPTITRSRDELLAADVQPFVNLRDRLPLIMVSHGHYTAFDGKTPKPATLSSRIITDLLRNQLGFTGVVVTDDMEMGAIHDFTGAVVESVLAGADLVLVCHSPDKIMAAYEAFQKIKIPSESSNRIQRLLHR
ncbi:MAG: beta-N-acetylhexosaminidase [Verrucomicrobiota bacterium]